MTSLRMVSLAVRVSSSDSGCDSSRVRRKTFSTSVAVIGLPSTTAQVSAVTGAAVAGVPGVDRHAVPADDAASTARKDEKTAILASEG